MQLEITLDVDAYLKSMLHEVENRLTLLVPQQTTPYHALFTAARYSLLQGAKRLRPILTLATTATFNTNSNKALNTACAIEMVHTYSLIHDDLPCMDNDDFRRGQPSLHKAHGEANALLAGDYLLTRAFEVIASDPHLNDTQKVSVITLLANNAGAHGMIGGQIMDISEEGKQVDLNTLMQMHSLKTGALITAAIEIGGIIAQAPQDQLTVLRRFGNHVGLAFQIVDDIIDITASKQKHGKEVASDTTNNKTTYVTLLGLEGAREAAENLLEKSHADLKQLPFQTTLLEELAKKLIHREF